jgi:carbamoylphosphate synthase large subunit
MTKDELVKAVKAHAVEHYESGGWDYLVECYSDEEVAELIGGARTVKGAIKKVGEVMGIKDDYRGEIEATAW